MDNMYGEVGLLGRQYPSRRMFISKNSSANPKYLFPSAAAGVPAPLPILYLPLNNASNITSISKDTGTRSSEF
jgi:hypothetical protein